MQIHLNDLYNLAKEDFDKERHEECIKKLNTILFMNPDNVACWMLMTNIYMKTKLLSLAELTLERVMYYHEHGKSKIPDKYLATVWNFHGYIATHRNDKDKAEEYFLKAVDASLEEDSDLYSNLGSLYVNRGLPATGLKWLDKGRKIDPDNNFIKWNSALCHLELGNYETGFKLYEAGFNTGDRVLRNYRQGDGPATPTWNGEGNCKVVVYGEQGIGDEILFSSMIPDLLKENVEVIIESHPRLANIFRNSFPCHVYGTRKDSVVGWLDIEKPDFQLSMCSLGKFYRKKLSDFPKHEGYLKPDPELKQFYKELLDSYGDKPKIGISWKGGTFNTMSKLRSLSLDSLSEILKQDATFISLQYTPLAKEESENHGIIHWQESVDNYDHTAALVSNLDLVISVCTSVIHLSGAMNIPCWVLTPSAPAWRYRVKGDDMPWYPSVKLFRQTDSWEPVIKTISGELCNLLAKNTAH